MATGDLVTRIYSDFLGVDFSNNHVSAYRSPDSKNIWKNYKQMGKCLSNRPGLKLFKKLDGTIYGLFFYKIATVQHMIIHIDTSLIDYNMQDKTTKTIVDKGMNPFKSQSFIFKANLYIKDGLKYYVYDGNDCKEVIGYIPETSMARAPEGGGKSFLPVNMLTSYRSNGFIGDGKAVDYYLDTDTFEAGTVSVTVNGARTTAFTEHPNLGYITFNEAPSAPYTDGEENVIITFSKPVEGEREKIDGCNVLEAFDNHIFFSGNEDYPNAMWYSEVNDPTYIPDNSVINEGMDGVPIRSMVAGGGKLWVFKEPSQSKQSIFYHIPSIMSASSSSDSDTGYTDDVQFPSQHSNISIGCVSTAVNFNDDVCLFSDFGLEGITSSTINDYEQITGHRSSLVDAKLLSEEHYKDPVLAEWQGYLLIFIDNHVYLADSRQQFTNITHNEYEWYYWELPISVSFASVLSDELYICSKDGGIYTLSTDFDDDDVEKPESYWTTCQDYFENPVSQKVTNKKGCIMNLDGEEVTISTKTDNNDWEEIDIYTNTKGYIVPRIKKKKWKTIQFMFKSTKKIDIYDFTVQCYVGGYVKR